MSTLSGDLEVGRAVYNYVNKCFTVRSELLSYKNENDILKRTKSCITRSGRLLNDQKFLTYDYVTRYSN